MRLIFVILLMFSISGCTTYGVVSNKPKTSQSVLNSYSMHTTNQNVNRGEYTIVLTMSGGGTRAAALSYGVLKELRNKKIHVNDKIQPLLDEVDYISAVSGGSFTAAYYGLYGDKLFSNFEDEFLYHDIRGDLFSRFLSPTLWFAESGRTEEAISYYQNHLFADATFADLNQPEKPLIVINASDLGGGVRFSFLQEYFDLLCSDLSSYPIANAVTASSAVPLLFNPIVLKNYPDCEKSGSLQLAYEPYLDQLTKSTAQGLKSYADKEKRQYIHLVDGGVTDNLGLLALYDIVKMGGGGEAYFQRLDAKPLPYFLIISIDASTKPDIQMELSTQEPSIADTVAAMTDIQLHRYNDLTKQLMKESIDKFVRDISTEDVHVSTYFVDINLNEIEDKQKKYFLNNIPTDFNLEKEQVDSLIAEGMQQLLSNTEYQRFLRDIGAASKQQ